MKEFWNKRYSSEDYAYGETPNEYVKQELSRLKQGKIIFPAEGEGRNAVYAATRGWNVTAFDPSTEGKKKAEFLARKHNVGIDYHITDYEGCDFAKESFDCLVLVYAHMPPSLREMAHKKLTTFLKPGGKLILEGFSKKQIRNNTGGPRNIDFLFSEDELRSDFSDLSQLEILEKEVFLDEGPFHQGTASVIRITGEK